MANHYRIGRQVVVSSAFKNLRGVPTDPTTVTLKYRDGSGMLFTVNSGALTHAGPGVYTYAIDTTGQPPGRWPYRFEGAGTLVAAEDSEFIVDDSPVLHP